MAALVRHLLQPLADLTIDVDQIAERPQRPEALAQVADAGALDGPLFPAGGRIAGPGIEAVLAGESQEARLETDQATVPFRDGSQKIVIPDSRLTPPYARKAWI